MIPGGRLSTTPIPAPLVLASPQPSARVSRHRGGINLQDSSQGLNVQTWVCETNGTNVTLRGETVPQTTLFTGTGITEVSLAFDQNMNPFVAFVDAGGPKFRWFDPQIPGIVITSLPAGSQTPRCCLDDGRVSQLPNGDIILAYVRAGILYYRQQRDRFLIEYQLASGLFAPLRSVAMNRALRLQFHIGATPP